MNTSRTLRATARSALATLGVLEELRAIRRWMSFATDRMDREREGRYRKQFSAFRRQYQTVLGFDPSSSATSDRTALVIGRTCPTLEVELVFIKALQLAGYRPVVLLDDRQRALRPFYRLATVNDIRSWSDFPVSPGRQHQVELTAQALVDQRPSLADLFEFEQAGVRIGRTAACTALRHGRVGSLDMAVPHDRQELENRIVSSLMAAAKAERILHDVRPELALFAGTEYTPEGEVFDACVANGCDVLAYELAHKVGAVMLKRYSGTNRNDHPSSLSSTTWGAARNLEWTNARRDRLAQELARSYASGDWFGAWWTQSNTRMVNPVELRARLGLDASKKVGFIFPHILWDAPVKWADTLFPTYEAWLLETVRAACANDRVSWVIKIHPANAGKRAKWGYAEEPAEVRVLREQVGALPQHVVIIPAETDISTASCFELMDYCLTVRGTVGIEAARLGIPVLTAAASRYSARGFTVDSQSRQEYLARIARIDETPRLSNEQRELAERFAYAMFVMRPLVMTSVTWDFGPIGSGRSSQIHLQTPDAWREAPDIAALVEWIGRSQNEDFLSADDSCMCARSGAA